MHKESELQFKINLLLAMASVTDLELARKNAQIVEKDRDLVQKDDLITRITQDIALKDSQIARLAEDISLKDRRVCELLAAQTALLTSTSWRVMAVLRWLRRLFRSRNA